MTLEPTTVALPVNPDTLKRDKLLENEYTVITYKNLHFSAIIIYLRQGVNKAWSKMLVRLLQVVRKFMYFPPWSLWRYGKETSSVWFVRPYPTEVFP